MKVKAAPGIQVPQEDKPREFITEAEEVEVSNTTYYLRLVADGDLVDLDEVDESLTADTNRVKRVAKKEGE
ncbi:hypothetical protein [Gulbenkiania mobilis]|uniref:hypothetical protein n=1 Tax=Gulbenkiania mobilis TaxID=397457 RepID=UPI0006BBE24F|nr:hypothetical protein [Gulbenkiania mobilis]